MAENKAAPFYGPRCIINYCADFLHTALH